MVERVLNCLKNQRWPTRHDVCELFEESGCGWHARHLVSWGMVGTRWAWWSMPAMPTMSPHLDRQGHPLTTRPMTRRFLCNNTHHQARVQEKRELIALNFNQPVAALYQVLALVGLWGPSCGAPNYWPISPAQFETNHPQPR